MDEQRLDGNATGGILGEVFAFEMTSAKAACVHCGATGELGAQMAYVTEIGTVVRCSSCEGTLIRIVRQIESPQRYWLDLKGVQYLQFQPVS